MDWSEYLRPGFWESLVNKNDKRYAIKMINDIRFMEVDKSLRNIEINLKKKTFGFDVIGWRIPKIYKVIMIPK